MTNDQIAAKLDDLSMTLKTEFARVDSQFARVENRLSELDVRLTSLEEHSVTRSDVNSAVFQGLAFATAAMVGTIVVLNALGAFTP